MSLHEADHMFGERGRGNSQTLRDADGLEHRVETLTAIPSRRMVQELADRNLSEAWIFLVVLLPAEGRDPDEHDRYHQRDPEGAADSHDGSA
jgi:hypothetical protein